MSIRTRIVVVVKRMVLFHLNIFQTFLFLNCAILSKINLRLLPVIAIQNHHLLISQKVIELITSLILILYSI
jgi:hypothetical protein